ncbi:MULTISPECIES: HesA/MoeB/ThiF family protein [unclassified Paracoccus (in: a-proteobacteria)]|uniref:HesA/MoeB/ThiF family protein n=1 Tax=unclassified Paracoccus (in: a-proteobacteria) TaxID=2688777 RepID=UPI0021E16470|nr:molybdopterin-synthase adenylyltransferase MoeB [Paracoccus sp. SMMA_5]UXU82090.1 molybdopterin-synthase adenylyltransferase MoeB [Paracoccus sp. SMMA_5_TC]
MLFLAILGVLVAARLLGWPAMRGLALAAGLWLLALAVLIAAPGSMLARLAGGDARVWALLGGILALLMAYRAGLRRLHRRAALPQAAPEPPQATPEAGDGAALTDPELDRYARHIVLRELGGPGQMALRRSRVLVVGAGGLGAPVCLYLAAAGVGHLTVADDDQVSLSNLQRQVIFRSQDADRPKAEAARQAMLALNPHVAVTALNRRIGPEDAALIAAQDLVIDGTDSFASRQVVNALCVAAGVPLVAGAIAQWEGQVTIWDPRRGAPCMACIFPQAPAQGLAPACAEAGVVGPLPGVIGSLMALEAIKTLTGAGEPLRGRMLILDGLFGENRVMRIARRPDCAVCGQQDIAPG